MYLYIITHPKFEGWLKLGSTVNPQKRLDGYQVCVPDRAYIIAFQIETKKPFVIERYFNEHVAGNGTEWYKCTLGFAVDLIRELLANDAIIETSRPHNHLQKVNRFIKFDYLVKGRVVHSRKEVAEIIGGDTKDFVNRKIKANENTFHINGIDVIRRPHEN